MDGSWARGRAELTPRRGVLRLGAAAGAGFAAAGLLSACGSGGSGGGSGGGGGGNLVFLSDQLSTIQETADMRSKILSGFKGSGVSFTSFADTTQFVDQVIAQAKAGAGTLDLIGGLQGDFVALEAQVPLRDMSDVISELKDRNFPQAYLELAKIKGGYRFVPWITATYLMVGNKKALAHLPSGADVNSLTYDQLLAWGQALKSATGQQLIGFPAGPTGLIKRFFQGYASPSFTGGLNTTFKSQAAVGMWQYFKQLWAVTNPQSPTYAMMDEPLLSGEVWVAWDHAVRLSNALQQQPDNFVVFPAPSGPKGLGYEPVLGGLAIPSTRKRAPVRPGPRGERRGQGHRRDDRRAGRARLAAAHRPRRAVGHLRQGLRRRVHRDRAQRRVDPVDARRAGDHAPVGPPAGRGRLLEAGPGEYGGLPGWLSQTRQGERGPGAQRARAWPQARGQGGRRTSGAAARAWP